MAVEDIRISLELLAETVENLERQIEEKEAARAAAAKAAPQSGKAMPPQMDMFGNWTGTPVNDKNNTILAKKLDSTIDRIQNLLKEGAA